MIKSRVKPSLSSKRSAGLSVWRRIGRIPAALAIALLILLPFLPMPDMVSDYRAVAQDLSVSAQEAATLGLNVICEHDSTGNQHDQQAPVADHQCPVCAAMQQAASLLPPAEQPTPPQPSFVDGQQHAFAAIDATGLIVPSAFSPRGPPLA